MSSQDIKTQERIVPCPTCRGDSIFAPSNMWRPFCSQRCRQIDLGAWASESFAVEASPPVEDDSLPH
ncbi:DNA gyrase inhibitor YacG [Paucibacter sp. Y2R2-4]|uniref:DNA gyrase inhibitor YacG n=1 Tax=Paucibacter sp. Y2R2-4 TaxID=2893553 RepID=UPI0021E4D45C|nr:DNA gyrase inhibitor YacG [Paucibacter sp. Y2R2-4]MCV2350003.1 DNA gyrase inhibitor YacG [Paucibacter sp. Y2R2-4]